MDIKVQVRESEEEAYVVELSGEIDVYTSPKVKDAITELIDQGHYNLVINLEKVRYIDSTGLGVLIGGLKRVREHGGVRHESCVAGEDHGRGGGGAVAPGSRPVEPGSRPVEPRPANS